MPLYPAGKYSIEWNGRKRSNIGYVNYPHFRRMPAKIQAEVQNACLYQVPLYTHLLGHGFGPMTVMKPRNVFIAYPWESYMRYSEHRAIEGRLTSDLCWYANLVELAVRIDAAPREKEKMKRMCVVDREITKEGGGVLELAKEGGVLGTWSGMDQDGDQIEWQSITYVWRDKKML